MFSSFFKPAIAFQKRSVRVSWAGTSVVLVGLAGCTGAAPNSTETAPPATPGAENPSEERLMVVATSNVLCDLTQQIAQDTVSLTCLLTEGQDPHVYKPTPSDRGAIEDADLLLYGGYGYEPSLLQMIDATSTEAPKVAVFEEAVLAPIRGIGHADEHAHPEGDSSHSEDEHAHDEDEHEETESATDAQVPDPHVWHDAEHGAAIARVIQEHLSEIAPQHSDLYAQNTEAIASELRDLDIWIAAQVTTVPSEARKLVTTHDSFRYYASAYGFEVAGALSGLSTEEKPSAARLTELVDLVKDSQVEAIFAETTTNPQLIETVAKDAGVVVAEQPLYVESLGSEGSAVDSYQQMLVVNTCTIVNALGGTCDSENAPSGNS